MNSIKSLFLFITTFFGTATKLVNAADNCASMLEETSANALNDMRDEHKDAAATRKAKYAKRATKRTTK